MENKRLGKGLEELLKNHTDINLKAKNLDNVNTVNEEKEVNEIDLIKIHPSKFQQRKYFDQEKIKNLAQSIAIYGVIQPILVRNLGIGGNDYEIVAGERRYRAAQIAKLTKVPVKVIKTNDEDAFIISLIENLQRVDINPIEEAKGIVTLQKNFGLTQEEIAQKVAKSRSHIANIIRLLDLCDEVKNMLTENKISMGHARALLGVQDINQQIALANKIIEQNLSVRQIEKLMSDFKEKTDSTQITKPNNQFQAEYESIENKLKDFFHTDVKIKYSAKGKGKIEIAYTNIEALNQLLEKINPKIFENNIDES